MYFQSALKRKIWFNLLITYFPDFFLSCIVSWYFNSGVLGALLIFFLLEVTLFIIFVVRSFSLWFFNLYGYKKILAAAFLEDLKTNMFPEPNNIEASLNEYLERVSLEAKNSQPKFVAAYYLGYLECYKANFKFFYFFILIKAFEDALVEYKNHFSG